MAKSKRSEIQVGPQGRVVIPSSIRKELDIQPGEKLFASIEDGRLILEKREQIVERWKSRFSAARPELNLVDELIAERRSEAIKESES